MKSFHGNSLHLPQSRLHRDTKPMMLHLESLSSHAKGKQVAGQNTVARTSHPYLTMTPSAMLARSPADDSGCSSSTTLDEFSEEEEEEPEHFTLTSDWVPSTPLSPPPVNVEEDYFGSLHSTSSMSSPAPLTPPSTPTGRPSLPRTRSKTQSIATVPPPYHPSFARFILRRQQSIYKREEEGHESLPDYTCDVHLEAWLARKVEQTEPGVKAKGRTWTHQYCVIHGTVLKIFKYNVTTHPIIATPHSKPNVLLHTYSLLDAQVGRAIDYAKDPYAVRVRAAGTQMLFKLDSQSACIDLIETFRSAVNISSDLDERDLPSFVTLPRSRRRDPRSTRAAYMAMGMTEEANAVEMGQEEHRATGGTRDQAAEEGVALEGSIY